MTEMTLFRFHTFLNLDAEELDNAICDVREELAETVVSGTW